MILNERFRILKLLFANKIRMFFLNGVHLNGTFFELRDTDIDYLEQNINLFSKESLINFSILDLKVIK